MDFLCLSCLFNNWQIDQTIEIMPSFIYSIFTNDCILYCVITFVTIDKIIRSNINWPFRVTEVANGFACPAPGEVTNAGSFSRHAHPEDCRKYYICLEGVAREYGCPIGTVFKIGDSDGTGNCEDPEDVPGW